jgi:predicted outer membrane repeat protein
MKQNRFFDGVCAAHSQAKTLRVLAGMAALILAFGLVLTGCPMDGGANDGNDPANPPGNPVFTAKTDTSTANNEATLGFVGTNASSSDTGVATAAIVDGKIVITSVSEGTAVITVSKDGFTSAAFTVTVADNGAITIGTITKGEHSVTPIQMTSLAEALSGIDGLPGGADRLYVLEQGSESMAPVEVSRTGGVVTVTIDGGGRTVTLSENGALITIGSGVTLKLRNITLRGQGLDVDNTAALIQVQTGGTLELNDDVLITGNKSASYGGGVYVDGTFTMNAGEISDNTADRGGGVYVGSSWDGDGTFTMNNGKISGNTASAYGGSGYYGDGGGVYVGQQGTFTMSGGEISDNTADSGGGGVEIWGGTFTMSGGEISDNTADSSGGGVDVGSGGTFTMSDGKISGNTAGKISDNTAGGSTLCSGGGVKVDGTFTMSGGEISGNTSSNGGGVDVGSGTFTMSGGVISGNTASAYGGSGYYGYGGGVYIDYGTFTKKGGTIYGDTDKTAGNGNATDNTAGSGKGHAVYLYGNERRRDATADLTVELYAQKSDSGWIFKDTSTGGVGNTITHWEY